ncbi:MAG: helix-turn-helix domain-containing protein [Burkholderiales bacterium]|nr:helix-turn-helix domain-containing protein [Burkholderiales bacterium]
MEGVAAVERAISIVEALEAAKAPMTLSALAAATDLYKSTVLRLLVSLEKHGLVVRRQNQSYVLGPLAFRLGRAFEATYHLKEHLLPLMEQLVERGLESPSFHVWQDAETRLCLLRVDSRHSTLDRVRAGDLLPLKRGAAGKVLQRHAGAGAEAGPPQVEVSFGERDPLCGAIAAPVLGPGGECLGALSLSGPLERFTEPAVRKMVKPLLEACEAATRSLGGQWPVGRGVLNLGAAAAPPAPAARTARAVARAR